VPNLSHLKAIFETSATNQRDRYDYFMKHRINAFDYVHTSSFPLKMTFIYEADALIYWYSWDNVK
jgi:hypothetical protein